MTRLRVLLYLPDLDGGGAQRTLLNLASALHRIQTLQVRLALGRRDGPAARWLDPAVDCAVLPPGRARQQTIAVRREIGTWRPDVVLSTMLHGNLVAWLATRLMPGRPRLLLRETNSHDHRTDLSRLQRFLAGMAYRACDRFIALSEGVRREMTANYGLRPDRTVTLHNPVDLTPYQAAADRPRPIVDPEGPFRLLTVGRLTDQKNHACLLRAMAQLNDPRVTLIILGEGPLRPEIEALSKELGINGQVSLPGFSDTPQDAFASADAFVLPSRYEGFGHVIVEAMASGLPVIATDCPYGPADIIDSDEVGILVPNDDPTALAAAISLMRTDPNRAWRLSVAGKVRARAFSADHIAWQYADLIRHCVAESA